MIRLEPGSSPICPHCKRVRTHRQLIEKICPFLHPPLPCVPLLMRLIISIRPSAPQTHSEQCRENLRCRRAGPINVEVGRLQTWVNEPDLMSSCLPCSE